MAYNDQNDDDQDQQDNTPVIDATSAQGQPLSALDYARMKAGMTELPNDNAAPIAPVKPILKGAPNPIPATVGRLLAQQKDLVGKQPEADEDQEPASDQDQDQDEGDEEAPSKPPTNGLPIIKSMLGGSINFSGPEMGTVQNLQAAQQARNQAQLLSTIGGAGNIISAGIARANVNPQAEQLINEQIKNANNIVSDFKDQVAMQKDDPKSAVSQGFRDYMQRFGINVGGNFTAAEGEKLIPMVFKEYETELNREAQQQSKILQMQNIKAIRDQTLQLGYAKLSNQQDIAGQKQDVQEANNQNKAMSDVGKQITQLNSRGATKMASQNEIFADNALSLLNQYPDLNTMPKPQQELFIQEVAKIAKGGVATSTEIQDLLSPSLVSKVTSLASQIINNPTGAQASGFIKEFIPYLQELKQNSQKVIGKNINNIIESNSDRLSDDQYDTLQSLHKPYLDAFQGQKTQPSAQGNYAQDVIDYAKAHNITNDQAQAIKNQRTGGQ